MRTGNQVQKKSRGLIPFIVLVAVCAPGLAAADGCHAEYVARMADLKETVQIAALVSGTGAGLAGLGSAVQDPAPGAVSMIGGGATAVGAGISAATAFTRLQNLRSAFQVIEQARTGDGLELRQFHREVQKERRKDGMEPIQFGELIAQIVKLDDEKVFCEQGPKSYSEMKSIVGLAQR